MPFEKPNVSRELCDDGEVVNGVNPLTQVALPLRDRKAECGFGVVWSLTFDPAIEVGETFGSPVAERQGYLRSGRLPFRA